MANGEISLDFPNTLLTLAEGAAARVQQQLQYDLSEVEQTENLTIDSDDSCKTDMSDADELTVHDNDDLETDDEVEGPSGDSNLTAADDDSVFDPPTRSKRQHARRHSLQRDKRRKLSTHTAGIAALAVGLSGALALLTHSEHVPKDDKSQPSGLSVRAETEGEETSTTLTVLPEIITPDTRVESSEPSSTTTIKSVKILQTTKDKNPTSTIAATSSTIAAPSLDTHTSSTSSTSTTSSTNPNSPNTSIVASPTTTGPSTTAPRQTTTSTSTTTTTLPPPPTRLQKAQQQLNEIRTRLENGQTTNSVATDNCATITARNAFREITVPEPIQIYVDNVAAYYGVFERQYSNGVATGKFAAYLVNYMYNDAEFNLTGRNVRGDLKPEECGLVMDLSVSSDKYVMGYKVLYSQNDYPTGERTFYERVANVQ